jgi:uncharacterized protein Yka (UPF0111/DUF47 family)
MDSDEPVLGALDTPVAKLGREVQRLVRKVDQLSDDCDRVHQQLIEVVNMIEERDQH